ncbi:putative diacyglycerol O-acyltransferase MT1809 isoform X2 [Hydra vulgaris]|uniref:Diacyglycerol O-acyltransferase MT1809 isoform X2 n=1 Tax=Hydra vulgaris TaxID=6087 RepID=A0ABM4D5Z7_HYDVU
MAVLYLKYIEGSIPLFIHGILCALAYGVWLLFAAVCLPLILVFRFYSTLENFLITYRKLGTVFTPFDKAFIHESKENRNFIIGIFELEGEPNIEKIRKCVIARFLNKRRLLDKTYERLSQRVTKRYFSYVWEEESNFNIRQHIPIYKGVLPETKKDIEQLCSRLTDEEFPKDISPWMLKIIPKKDKSGFIIFAKVHHVIGDGYALIGLLSELVDQKPQFMDFPPRPQGYLSNKVVKILSIVLTGPLALLTIAFSQNLRNPFKATKGLTSKTISWTNPISLKTIKRIKSKTNTTVNDVMMSTLGGALRRYLTERGIFPDDQPVAMTFNLRSTSEMMKTNIPLGNNSGGLFLNLPLSVSDPVERLEVTKNRIVLLKKLSHEQMFSFFFYNVASILPDFFSRITAFALRRNTTLIVSNVPGPTTPLHILGSRLKSIVFTPPLHGGVGLVVSVFSYNEKLQLAVMTDETIIAKPAELTDAFEKEITLLENRVLIE